MGEADRVNVTNLLRELDLSRLEGGVYAAVDLGSNSFHMVVARLDKGVLSVIDRLKDMVRLAEGVDDDGQLSAPVRRRALDCLQRFGQRLEQVPAGNIRAVGTNALRRLKDGWRFLDEAERRLGHTIEIISGQEEARIIYLGVAHGISERGNQRLVIDIGGGSTEFIIGRDYAPIMLDSLYFGCVGITQRFFPDGKITRKRWDKARSAVAVELQRIAADFQACGWQEAIGSSGTMKSVRRVVLAQGWSEQGITPQSMERLRDELVRIGRSDSISLEGLSERRQPVFVGGAVVVAACIENLGIDRVLVTDYALREGLLYDQLGRILHADPRQGVVEMLMTRYGVDGEQARRVRRYAGLLFDQVSEAWGLSKAAGDLLAWAADLHELGLTLSHHGYHRHGGYLLENSDLAGFSRQDQAVLATLVGNHRRKPDPAAFDGLVSRIRKDVRSLAALLRLAVLINRSRTSRAVPDIGLQASSRNLRLSLPADAADSYPLTLVDLRQEARHLQRIGIKLSVKLD